MNSLPNMLLLETETGGFGLYALSQLSIFVKLPLSTNSLDKMWSTYRAEHEDFFTDVINVTSELSDLNRSENFFIDNPHLYHIFDYWKDKLLRQELPDLLSPEKLISWSTFEIVTLDMFYDMLEVEFKVDPTSDLDESILDTEDGLDLMGKLMHIVSPFMFLMLRYAYYQTWLKKTQENDDFRRNRATANYISDTNGLRLMELHDVHTGDMSAKRIYKTFANLFAQSIKGSIAETPRGIDEDNIDVLTCIAMAQLEVSRLSLDEAFLREHCQPFFVDSLIEWHRGYFAYLIHEIHEFEGYEKYQIPGYRVKETQKKAKVTEKQILTNEGQKHLQEIKRMILDCKTAADFGYLLYQLQYKKNYMTKNQDRVDYYRYMEKLGQVPHRDVSNCNKGWTLASDEDSKK